MAVVIFAVGLLFLLVVVDCVRQVVRVRRAKVFTIDHWRKVTAAPPHITPPKTTCFGEVDAIKDDYVRLRQNQVAAEQGSTRQAREETDDTRLRDKVIGWQDFVRASEMAQRSH
jgi:hypothetical protein